MYNNPKISVVIPVYNAEKYLRECLDSVVNQTLKDIEIICVNDGSTDKSHTILEEYAAQDDRIILLNQSNAGAGAARNKGIETAISEFVIFIDADDWYPSNQILISLYNNAKNNDVLICGGSFSSQGRNFSKSKYDGMEAGYTFNKDALIRYSNYQFDYGYHRFIYNLEMLKENNIYFPNYSRFQDPPFFIKAMLQAKEFYALKMITYCYRNGHREVNWNREKTNDLLKGLIDNLLISKEYELAKLHYLTVQRININYVKPILANINNDNIELLYLMAKANSLIDIQLLRQVKSDFPDKYVIEPLKQAVSHHQISSNEFLYSFNLYDMFTYLPHKATAFFSCLKYYGFIYTTKATVIEIRRVLKKIFKRK
jgi:glycosyltransferase involved in cell wall biosynthesis